MNTIIPVILIGGIVLTLWFQRKDFIQCANKDICPYCRGRKTIFFKECVHCERTGKFFY